MADFLSLDVLIATATIALVAIGIPLIAVLIRILFILNAAGRIVTTVAEEGARVKAVLARFFQKSKKKDT